MWLKHLHLTCVLLSFIGFALRGTLSWNEVYRAKAVWLRIAPHIIDTVLLISALALVMQWRLNPGDNPWLLAKLVLLPCYVGLGVIAMRATVVLPIRRLALVSALLVYCYIAMVAITKNPTVGLF